MSAIHKKLVDASRDFITLVDRDYVYRFANASYCREMGLADRKVVGRSVAEIWGRERFERRIKAHLDECFEGRESHDIDRFKFGEGFKYIHVSYYPYESGGKVTHAMIYSHDISAVKELEARLIDFEFKDPTTGLFNRKSFDIVLDMELEKAKRASSSGGDSGIRAVLFVNLRNFSQINARYGYEIGDLLLESTGIKIKDALRATDYVFRFEGKELAVILTTMKRAADIAIVAENIHGKATFPYNHRGAVINIGCNIGAAVFPDDGDAKEDLVRHAMSAMDEARQSGESCVIFNKELHRAALRKARLRSDIRHALVDEQFETYFQPVVDEGGAIVGAEALIRWRHPELGPVSPKDFIPLAEESGDTIMIGRWVLFRVCKHLRRWAPLLGERYVSVNLSAKEFGGEGLVEYVDGVLKAEGVRPSLLKLEITETQSMVDIEDAIEKIERLAAIGVEVFVDDFGSGYSSLAYLKRLPAAVIKIDKCFVDAIVEDDQELAFLAGMIGMIGGKDKEVLVEGVATREQAELLKRMGVERMQGFYYSEALPAPEFEALLSSPVTLPLPH
ncbi:MAG TPA: EAL domain-containing protein [Spirochaetales bacterium]|nr:EAL domain-containing protein [Spirochaetales bacterium]